MTASSTSGGRYFDTGRASHCICVTSSQSATISAPAAATTSYTNGVAEYTPAGANSYADTMNKGNEEWGLDSGSSLLMSGVYSPCGNNNRDSKDRHACSSDSAEVGRLPVCCAASQYVG